MKSNILTPYTPAIGHCICDTGQGAIAALLPLFIQQLGLSYQEAATLMFANTMMASVIQPLFGLLADRLKISIFIPLGLILVGSSIAGMGFTDSYWVLIILSLSSGLGSALFHPEGAMLANQLAGAQKGKALGLFSVGGNAGFAIGPLLAGGAYLLGPHYLFVFFLLGLMGALLYQIGIGINTSKKEDAPSNPSIAIKATNPKEAKQEKLTNDWKSFSRLSFIIAARSTLFSVLNTFIPLYWINCLYQSVTTANWALTFFYSIGAILTYYGGRWSDSLGFMKIIRYAYIVLLPTLYIFANSDNIWLSYLMMLPVAYGVFSQYSPIVVLGQNYLKKNVAFSSGITLGLGVSFGGLMTPLFGFYADIHGIQAALNLLVPITIVAFILSFFLKDPHID